MSRLDFRATDDEILQRDFIRFLKAAIATLMQEINQLRLLHGQPVITKAQFLAKVKSNM